jgi:renalase
MSRPEKIAVIGAGLAGLSAARGLARAGAEVAVFDKARRPGGRVSTRRAEVGAFDHGAQYFTAREPDFAPVVSDWCRRGVAQPWDAPIVRLAAGPRLPAPGDGPRHVGVPGMSALARDLAADLPVRCEQRIDRVERMAGRWRLVSEGGSTEPFDAVVIATPAPQAVPLLDAVPALAESVAAVTMLPCQAALVAFERPLAVDFAAAFVDDSPLAWIARNASKPGRTSGECWVLHASPTWSAQHLEDAPDAIADALLAALAAALGSALPGTSYRAAHRWRFARAERPLGHVLWDPEARLGVCGDWTLGDRIASAFLSGAQLARAMRADLRSAAPAPAPRDQAEQCRRSRE